MSRPSHQKSDKLKSVSISCDIALESLFQIAKLSIQYLAIFDRKCMGYLSKFSRLINFDICAIHFLSKISLTEGTEYLALESS